jgi:hypothetical protein
MRRAHSRVGYGRRATRRAQAEPRVRPVPVWKSGAERWFGGRLTATMAADWHSSPLMDLDPLYRTRPGAVETPTRRGEPMPSSSADELELSSPELILVSPPELAAQARLRLPPPGRLRLGGHAAHTTAPIGHVERGSSRRLAIWTAVALLLSGVASVLVPVSFWFGTGVPRPSSPIRSTSVYNHHRRPPRRARTRTPRSARVHGRPAGRPLRSKVREFQAAPAVGRLRAHCRTVVAACWQRGRGHRAGGSARPLELCSLDDRRSGLSD